MYSRPIVNAGIGTAAAGAPASIFSVWLAVGLLILGSLLTDFWTGSVAVPAALAIALLVFGGYLVTLRAGLARIGLRGPARLAGFYEGHLDPVFVTDLSGRVLARNPAGRSASLGESDGLRYRLARARCLQRETRVLDARGGTCRPGTRHADADRCLTLPCVHRVHDGL